MARLRATHGTGLTNLSIAAASLETTRHFGASTVPGMHRHEQSLGTVQAAAEEVAREHPDGIDFLIVNAGVVDPKHKSGIAT